MTYPGGTLEMPEVKVRLVRADARLPAYMTDEAAGMDLYACVAEELALPPGARQLVPTGIAIELPPGYEAQVRPRSGLALKHGVTVLNAPGTIDADYRGEVMVLLVNHGDATFVVRAGDRVAQLIVAPVVRARLVVVETLGESARGDGGYGHTGS